MVNNEKAPHPPKLHSNHKVIARYTTRGVLTDNGTRTTVGVRQDCPLSSCLFNLFPEEIMTRALDEFEGTLSVGGRRINNLRFADDIDHLAGSMIELDELTKHHPR